MKRINLTIVLTIITISISLAQPTSIDTKLSKQYFDEIDSLLSLDNGNLWNISLKGPIMFADSETREIVSNQQTKDKTLQEINGAFYGYLPEDVIIANTSFHYKDEIWTMVKWPLPKDKLRRLDLMAHESYHHIQDQLPFKNGDSVPLPNHLDTKENRILLKLEIEALHKALLNDKTAFKHALYFRHKRFKEIPEAEISEIYIETNEGLATYTGYKLAYTNPFDKKTYFKNQKDIFYDVNSFTRASAYFTGPLYGELFDQLLPDWKSELKDSVNFLMIGLNIINSNIYELEKLEFEEICNVYNYKQIVLEEKNREVEKEKQLKAYKEKFLNNDVFIINLINMQIGFDPSNIIPLGEYGTIYPVCRIVDNFGIFNTTKGVLLTDWSKITITPPISITETLVEGDGWKIELNPGWKVIKDGNSKFKMIKN